MKVGDIVKIEYTGASDFESAKDVRIDELNMLVSSKVVRFGALIYEDEHSVTVSSEIDSGAAYDTFNKVVVIPKNVIVSAVVLLVSGSAQAPKRTRAKGGGRKPKPKEPVPHPKKSKEANPPPTTLLYPPKDPETKQ